MNGAEAYIKIEREAPTACQLLDATQIIGLKN